MAALTAPGMVNRLQHPHSFWVARGMAFLLTMALGYLPAPPAPGDIAGRYRCAADRTQARAGTGRHTALRFTAFGLTDLVVSLTLGALSGFALINVTPSGAPISGPRSR